MGRFSLHPGCAERAAYRAKIEEKPSWVQVAEEQLFDPEAAKSTDEPFPEELQEYSSMTVAELKALCAERGLAVSGTKNELIERLNLNDASDSTEAPAEEAAVEEVVVAPAEEAATTEETVEGEVSESGGENSGEPTE